MAARVNTKFVLILFIVITTVAGVVAGILFYQNRTNVGRAVARGDEQMQLGDYRLARTFYSRALGKDPANPLYLEKLEDALTRIQPETMDEASELYRAYISLRKHDAQHHPLDAEKHIAYLDEVRNAARRSNGWWYWELTDEAAEYMLDRVAPNDPERVVANLYMGEARTNERMVDRLSEDDVQAGVDALREYVAARPADESGWAALATALLVRAERFHAEGMLTQEEQVVSELEEVFAEAGEKVEEGPNLLIASLQYGLYRMLLRNETLDEAAVLKDTTRLVDLLADSDDAWLVGEVVELLDRYRWIEASPRPLEVVDRFLAEHPEAHGHRLLQARLHSYLGNLEAAEASTKAIIDAELLHVSYVSQIQFELKRRAASLNVDIAVRRWELADEADKPARLEDIKTARAMLESLVTDPDNDPLLLRANGKIAYVEERFGDAAAIFNRLATDQSSIDFETLMYAAVSLERRGEYGAAAQRIEQALTIRPGNNAARLHSADLRIRMGQYEVAQALVDQALEMEPENETAKELNDRIERLLNPDEAIAGDPILKAISDARTAVLAGEYDSARSTLSAARAGAPDDFRLMNALIRTEMAAGRTDAAKALLDDALTKAPDSRVFRTLQAFVENPDPVARVQSFVDGAIEDEVEKTLELVHGMRLLAINMESDAEELERAGDAEGAAETRDIAQRARAEMEQYRETASRIAPEHPRFLELRFLEGLANEDWDEVEKVIVEAARLNADQAGGALYQGRYEIARNRPREASKAFALATERIPYSAIAWRLLARCYQRLGEGTEALLAYERAYANNPSDVRTVLAYGRMLSASGNDQRAVAVFREGRRIAPDDPDIRDAWLLAEQAAGNSAVALVERRKQYEEDPDDTRNAAALAKLLGSMTPSRELLLDDEGNFLYSVDRWTRLPERGTDSKRQILAEAQRAWHAESDAIVEAISPPDERDLGWHVLRAELFGLRGEIEEGIKLLTDYADSRQTGEEQFRGVLAVGLYLSRFNRKNDAISVLSQARNIQEEGDIRADVALGDLLFEATRYEEALESFEVVQATTPNRKLEMKIAECNIRLDRLDDARRQIDQLEASTGVDATSLLLRATLVDREADILWEAGKANEAQAKLDEFKAILRRAEEAAPTDPMPHVMLASALLKEHERTGNTIVLDDALLVLGRAEEVRPQFARATLVRVAVLRAQGNDRGAINELTALVEREPGNFQARQILVQFLMADGRRDDAVVIAEEAVRRDPTLVLWRVGLGDIYNGMAADARDRLREATPGSRTARTLERTIQELEAKVDEQYAAAIDLVPNESLIIKRTATLLASDPPKYNQVLEVLEEHQDLFETSPMLRMLYGQALGRSGFADRMSEQMRLAYQLQRKFIDEGKAAPGTITRWYMGMRDLFGPDGAEEIEQMALELSGGTPDAYELFSLAGVWRLRGTDGMSRAIELLKQSIAAAPEEDTGFRAQAYSDLGTFYVMNEQYRDAREVFEKVLTLDPDNAQVLNNLAYLLAEKLDDPKSALPYALQGVKLMPESWSVLDTVGRIYFLLQEYENAEQYLRDSEELEITATNQFHLAEVFAAQQDYDRARRRLREAAELDPDPSTKADINRLADDIRTKR